MQLKISRLLGSIKVLFKQGFIHILFGNYLTQALGFLSSIIAVRLIDKVMYANLTYADNIVAYATIFSGMGFAAALVKYVSDKNSVEKDSSIFKYSLKTGLICQAVITVLAILISYTINTKFEHTRLMIDIQICIPILNYIIALNQSYNRAHLKNKFYGVIGSIQTAILIITSILLARLLSAYGIVIARYISLVFTCFISGRYVYKILKHGEWTLDKETKKQIWKTALSLMLTNMLSWIMPLNEIFLVNNIIADEVVTANFKVAGLIPSQLAILASSITVFAFPQVMRLESRKEIKLKVQKIGIVCAVTATIMTVFGILLMPVIINVFYGEQYSDSISLSYVLWIMRYVNAAVRTVPLTMLVAVNDEKFCAIIAVLTCVVQSLLDYFLINTMGIYGVAVGAIFVYLVSGIACWLRFNKICEGINNNVIQNN